MPRSAPIPSRLALAALATAALLATAVPARAGSIFELPLGAESRLVPAAGTPAPLTGSLRLELVDLPFAGATEIRLLDVAVSGGGLSVRLDPAIAAAGLGVLYEDGSFLFPTLFLALDGGGGAPPLELAIPDLTGEIELVGLSLRRLVTSFAVDSLGSAGVVTVHVVATPEPGTALLAGLGLVALVAGRVRGGRDR